MQSHVRLGASEWNLAAQCGVFDSQSLLTCLQAVAKQPFTLRCPKSLFASGLENPPLPPARSAGSVFCTQKAQKGPFAAADSGCTHLSLLMCMYASGFYTSHPLSSTLEHSSAYNSFLLSTSPRREQLHPSEAAGCSVAWRMSDPFLPIAICVSGRRSHQTGIVLSLSHSCA